MTIRSLRFEDDKHQIGVGLGCNGRIEVLFTPIDPNDPQNPIEQLRRLVSIDRPTIMLKVIESNDTNLGLRQIITTKESSKAFATLSTDQVQSAVSKVLDLRKSMIVEEKNQKILVEFIRPEIRLVIVGDNYDVSAFTGIAHELGWEIYVVGKAKKLSKQVFQLAKQVVDYRQADEVAVHDYTAVVLMSHDYGWDKLMLPIFVAKQPFYIGMLGPKKRMLKMQDQNYCQEMEERTLQGV